MDTAYKAMLDGCKFFLQVASLLLCEKICLEEKELEIVGTGGNQVCLVQRMSVLDQDMR